MKPETAPDGTTKGEGLSDGDVFTGTDTRSNWRTEGFVIGVGNDQPTYTDDGITSPHQLLTVELIGPAEVVDDFGDGLSGLGMAFVVGKLVICDRNSFIVDQES